MKLTETRTVTPEVVAVCWNSAFIASPMVMSRRVTAFRRAARVVGR
jgi:hypothetical protein